MSNGGGITSVHYAHPILINNIFWANTPREIHVRGNSSANVSYCDVRGGYEGTGNIDIDPFIVAAYEEN